MGFRMRDLMSDVWPGRGYELANDRCTCAASAGGQPEAGMADPPDEPDPDDEPLCLDTLAPSGDCPSEMDALAADLAGLRAQLRRDLGQGAQTIR